MSEKCKQGDSYWKCNNCDAGVYITHDDWQKKHDTLQTALRELVEAQDVTQRGGVDRYKKAIAAAKRLLNPSGEGNK